MSIINETRYFINKIKSINETVKNDEFYNWFGRSKVINNKNKPLLVYHFTNTNFKDFDLSYARNTGYSSIGFWFGSNLNKTSYYGNIKKSCYLQIEDPLYIDTWNDFIFLLDAHSITFGNEATEFREYLIKKHYDGIIFKNVDIDGNGKQNVYVVFENYQIKCNQ